MTGAATRLFCQCANRFRIRCSAAGAVVVGLLLCAAQSASASPIVDQSYLPFNSAGEAYNLWSNDGNLPLGQQFVPTLPSLSFVNLWLEDAATGTNGSGTIQVEIRSGSISGTILGTATAVVPPGRNTGGGNTLTQFNFSSPISLTPGATYVIDAAQIAPITITPPNESNINFLWIGGPTNNSTYAPGEAYIKGTLQPTFDFAFDEGVLSLPEPATCVLAATSLLVCAGFQLRRRRAASHA
jgi:hypothetical protein